MTVRCPYCDAVNRPQFTGWGRTGLNMRVHCCKVCQRDYGVVMCVETDKDIELSDMSLSALRARIAYLKKRRRKLIEKEEDRIGDLAREVMRLESRACGQQN